jgi:Arc/MetJ family transcription regulator
LTKRLVEIEDSLLDQARRALGTDTIKDTVTSALEQAVRAAERRTRLDDATLERFAAAATDLGDGEVMGAAWR